MIYLDNAATTFPKPIEVYDLMNNIQRSIAVNIGRGSYKAAREAQNIVDETRKMLAEFVKAKDSSSVVFTPSATLAANEIIWGLEWDQYKNVYVTPFEHNAIIRPLEMARKKYGFHIKIIPFNPETQELEFQELGRLFSIDHPDYVFINHVSNVTGTILPVDIISEAAKEFKAVTVVDGSQSVGLINIDLKKSMFDYLIFAGHKNLYSSWGIGGFIDNSSEILTPFLAGGTGSDSLNPNMQTSTPDGFEFGSQNILAIASLNASLKWINKIGISGIAIYKENLMQQLEEGLMRCHADMYLPKDMSRHTSVISFNLSDYEPAEVGMILDQDYDIAVRTGYHCAPYIHDLIGTKEKLGTIRVSIGYFNTEEEIKSFIRAIEDITGGMA